MTSVPFTLSPASAVSPATTSAVSTASQTTNTSMQSSPEILRGRDIHSLDVPSPLQLSTAMLQSPPFSTQSAMTEAMAMTKSPGIIRRLSQGAANQANRLRRRTSSNHVMSRDRSSGPVVTRHRANSKTTVEGDQQFPAPALEPFATDTDLAAKIQGLGISTEGLSMDGERQQPNSPLTEGGLAPIVSDVLCRGTKLLKVTKKKRKELVLKLDAGSAKVSWNDSNPSKKFYVDDIQDLRLQRDAKNYREDFQMPPECESRWFTIIYKDPDRGKGRQVKTMHLIAPTQHTFELWISTLHDLKKYRHDLMVGLAGFGQDEKILKGHWNREMARLYNGSPCGEEDECLDLQGVQNLCRSLHIYCSPNVLRAQFNKVDSGESGKLNFPEFKDFVRHLKHRTDIKDVFKAIDSSNEGLDLEQFLHFLQHTQGVNVEPRRQLWTEVFERFTEKATAPGPIVPASAERGVARMNAAAFQAFLSSQYNNIQALSSPDQVRLDRPLNEYFISSSHNTYLMGRQVAGSSSTEAYIRALQRACRCVEIDCWDGPDGRPVVVHGRTLTSKVLFSDCISVIRKYAFTSSEYPLIISLEVHCNPEQQQAMVDIMVDILGDHLVTRPLMTNVMHLPSPEDLRQRILIKVKAGPKQEGMIESPAGSRQRSLSSPWSRPQIIDNSNVPQGTPLSNSPSVSPSEASSASWLAGHGSVTATSMSSATEDSDAPARKRAANRKSKIIGSLGDLGIYTQGIKFNHFGSNDTKAFNHVVSIAERRFESLCQNEDTQEQLERHNMRHLMRIYPSGYRVKSSNPDPLLFWRKGVQMTALNWQTYDLGMQLNDAMFACGADRTGYVLKPRELRHPSAFEGLGSDDMNDEQSKKNRKMIKFSVDLFSAQQIPRPRGISSEVILDPYVEIEMFSAENKAKGLATGEGGQDASARSGMSGIGSPHRRRSRIVQANGWNPVFDDEFKFSVETRYPSLVFVRWRVWNSPDGRNYVNNPNAEPLATFTAKLSNLEEGYRHLPLHDHNGDQFLFATLFCRIKKEEPVVVQEAQSAAEKPSRYRGIGQVMRSLSQTHRDPDRKKSSGLDGKGSSSHVVRQTSMMTMSSVRTDSFSGSRKSSANHSEADDRFGDTTPFTPRANGFSTTSSMEHLTRR